MSGSVLVRSGLAGVILLGLFSAGCSTPAQNGRSQNLWKRWPDLSFNQQQEGKQNNNLHLSYAKWQEKLGNLSQARQSYQTALGEDPQSIDAMLGLARLDQLAGRTNEAKQKFQKLLQRKPNDPRILAAMGQFYASQKRWPEAAEKLQAATLADPEKSQYRYNLAVALTHAGQTHAAMPHFVQTVGKAEAHYNVGLILRKKGQLRQSEQHFLQAVAKRPQLKQAQYWLKEVRGQLGNSTKLAGAERPARQTRPQTIQPHQKQSAPSAQTVINPSWQTPPSNPVNSQASARQTGPVRTTEAQQKAGRQKSPQPNIPPGMTPQQYEQWKNQVSPQK